MVNDALLLPHEDPPHIEIRYQLLDQVFKRQASSLAYNVSRTKDKPVLVKYSAPEKSDEQTRVKRTKYLRDHYIVQYHATFLIRDPVNHRPACETSATGTMNFATRIRVKAIEAVVNPALIGHAFSNKSHASVSVKPRRR
jgi:hypothetical protein